MSEKFGVLQKDMSGLGTLPSPGKGALNENITVKTYQISQTYTQQLTDIGMTRNP
jgi:hypothetical protein